MDSKSKLATLIALTAALAACGGGGGTTPPTISGTAAPSSTPSPVPTASSSSSPPATSATVSGTVVDYDNNTPLSGATIGLAPWTAGATPAPQATTNASGQFSFMAKTGKYLLVVTSANTATLNQSITVAAPATQVTADPEQSLSSQNGFTPNAAQTSGSLRLISLTGAAAAKYNVSTCVTGFNQGRAANSGQPVTIDEYLTEDAIANVQQQYANNVGNGSTSNSLRSGVVPYGSFGYGSDTATASGEVCLVWTDTFDFTESQSGSAIYGAATNAAYVWYGVAFDSSDLVLQGGGDAGYGTQIWGADPR